jgi:N,N-dimethylformamidase
LNADGGGAEMVIDEPGNGGGVFSAGSICWPSSVLVDPAVARITANVLRRFSE